VLWTKDVFYVAREGNVGLVDSIPLHEVLAVMEMNDEQDNAAANSSSRSMTSMMPDIPLFDAARRRGVNAAGACTAGGDDGSSGNAALRRWNNCLQAKSVLQIKTAPDGLNSGRTYYLSTRNGEDPERRRQAFLELLCDAVEAARRRAEAKSRFEKSQERVQWVQGSMAFQVLMAILIIVVSESVKKCWHYPVVHHDGNPDALFADNAHVTHVQRAASQFHLATHPSVLARWNSCCVLLQKLPRY
jgi:hypothetical protein